MQSLSILVLFSLVASSAADEGSDWPQHRGSAGSSGVSEDDSITPPLRLVWSYRCDSDTTGDAGAGLTVGGGKVFCNMEMTRSILALDAHTGAFAWEFFHNDVHYQQTSSYAEEKLFVWLRGRGHSSVVALNSDTGEIVWERKLKSSEGVIARRSGPVIVDGKVLLADGDGASPPAVICFDAGTGEELWRKQFDERSGRQVMAPSIAGGKVFTGTSVAFRRGAPEAVHGAAVALDLETGEEIWRNRELVPTRPLVSDGKITIVKFNGQPAMGKGRQKVSVLDAATGKELWSVPIWIIYGTTTITDKLVILKYYGARMVAYDRATGEQVWESRYGGGSGCSSPSVSGKYAFVGTGSFNDSEGIWAWRFASPPHQQDSRQGVCWSFHAIDLESGESVWHCVTGNNACGDPAIAYGKLYLNSRDGRIYCYEPMTGKAPARPDSPDASTNVPKDEVQKLLAQTVPAGPPGRDWPTESGTNLRTGSPDAELTTPMEQAWTLAPGGRIDSSPVVASGRAYVGSLSGRLVCADLKRGRQQWTFEAGGPIHASAAVTDGTVYCGCDDGRMYALDAATGEKLWHFSCGGPVQCSPAVSGGAIFFGANDYHFYALDRKTGKKLWSFKTEHPLVITTPVVHGDTVYCSQWVDWLYALDAATGTVRWGDCVPISIEKLHYYRDRLYVRSARQIAQYDPATGKRLRLANAVYGYNGLAFHEDLVINTGTGSASVVDLRDAGVPSRYQDQPALEGVMIVNSKSIGGWPRLAALGAPLVVGDRWCFASVTGELILTEPNLGQSDARYQPHEIQWTAQLGGRCHSSPIVADGHLLVGCDDGRLYAFRSMKSRTSNPTPP